MADLPAVAPRALRPWELAYDLCYQPLLWVLGALAFVRWSLFFLHVYNPYLPFLDQHHPLVELLICLLYTTPAVAWRLLRWRLEQDGARAAAWAQRARVHEQPLPDQQRWGGPRWANALVVAGALLFALVTGLLIASTAIEGRGAPPGHFAGE